MTGREPRLSCEPSDRREQPLQDKMNKTAASGRNSAAPSSPASAANRIRTTESLFAEAINEFCNKICQTRTHASRLDLCAGQYLQLQPLRKVGGGSGSSTASMAMPRRSNWLSPPGNPSISNPTGKPSRVSPAECSAPERGMPDQEGHSVGSPCRDIAGRRLQG